MKIAWVTPNSFVDVDLPIIAELHNYAEIYWQVLIDNSNIDQKQYIESKINGKTNIKYEYVNDSYRVYDLRTLVLYCRILNKAKKFKPDIYYTSLHTAPFGPIVYKLFWPIKKSIIACHNVSTPKGANREFYARFYTYLTLRSFNNIQVFSDSQKEILLKKFPYKNVLMAPLAIKDYGEPTKFAKGFDENRIVFLFFGIISPYKRLDLLINAAENIYDQGYKNFKVKIAGSCRNWSDYLPLIKHKELFEIRIERIPNSEVADLFAESDYFVMPYQDIAQSGAITVAYRYNLPIILSNLPQFKPFCIDGKTGLFFKSTNVRDLGMKMIQVLEGGKTLYDNLRGGLEEFVEEQYSTPAICQKYMCFFDQLTKL